MVRALKEAFVLLGVLAAFGSATASSPVVVPLRVVDHFPIVMAKVDGLDVPLIFGSGDSPTVVLQQSVLDHIKAAPLDEISKGLDAKGNLLHAQKFRVSRQVSVNFGRSREEQRNWLRTSAAWWPHCGGSLC